MESRCAFPTHHPKHIWWCLKYMQIFRNFPICLRIYGNTIEFKYKYLFQMTLAKLESLPADVYRILWQRLFKDTSTVLHIYWKMPCVHVHMAGKLAWAKGGFWIFEGDWTQVPPWTRGCGCSVNSTSSPLGWEEENTFTASFSFCTNKVNSISWDLLLLLRDFFYPALVCLFVFSLSSYLCDLP